MFFDTATLRDSVVSHAKELNYLPRSYASAAATVRMNVAVTNNAVTSVTVPRGYRFTSTAGSKTFTFSTAEPYGISRNSQNQFVRDIIVYEGFILSEKYIVNNAIENQRFVLSNPKVDTDSIEVFVSSSTGSNNFVEYNFTSSIFGLNANSNVYFLQAAESEKYEVVFGDNVISKRPNNGNVVRIDYRIASGSDANGVNVFNPRSAVESYSATASTVTSAAGGSENESISSIKFNATRFFQTQDRTVTKDDYRSLILANFPEIKSVNVYGGEEVPLTPQYGRVFASCVTQTGNPITLTTADRIIEFVKVRSPLAININLIDPEFLDIIVDTTVYYNVNLTTLTAGQISSLVNTAISNFNTNSLIDFNKIFRYSRLVSDINNAHVSIVSNETSTTIAKTIVPILNENYSTVIDFGNGIKRDDFTSARPLTNEFTLYSSQITYNSRAAFFGEDGAGGLFIYENTSTSRSILKDNAGTIDYVNGLVNINSIVINNYVGEGITFFAIPAKQDISSLRNTVVRINNLATQINVVAVKE